MLAEVRLMPLEVSIIEIELPRILFTRSSCELWLIFFFFAFWSLRLFLSQNTPSA